MDWNSSMDHSKKEGIKTTAQKMKEKNIPSETIVEITRTN